MTYALFFMANCKKDDMKLSSKQYEKARLDYSTYKSEDMKGSNNPFFGMHHSEESKRKISESHKGLKPVLGRKWFTNGVECALAETCPDGFQPGRIVKS